MTAWPMYNVFGYVYAHEEYWRTLEGKPSVPNFALIELIFVSGLTRPVIKPKSSILYCEAINACQLVLYELPSSSDVDIQSTFQRKLASCKRLPGLIVKRHGREGDKQVTALLPGLFIHENIFLRVKVNTLHSKDRSLTQAGAHRARFLKNYFREMRLEAYMNAHVRKTFSSSLYTSLSPVSNVLAFSNNIKTHLKALTTTRTTCVVVNVSSLGLCLSANANQAKKQFC